MSADTDGGNSFDGRIWVRDEDREWVNDHKHAFDASNQAGVLRGLIEFYETHDPAADSDGVSDDVDAIADAVAERVDVAATAEVDPDAVAAALAERIDTGEADPAAIAKETADEVERRLR